MHLYGGVWVIGNLVTHDADCREICVAAEFDPLRDKGEA
jgi:acetyl esterase/lipase